MSKHIGTTFLFLGLMGVALLCAGCIEGPQGPPGERGIEGAVGPEGSQGETGERGEAGSQGPEGSQGERGVEGEKGLVGLQGIPGPRGDAGIPATRLADTFEQVRESVVCVQVRDAETEFYCGTGFYIDDVGTVLTAMHVVDIEGLVGVRVIGVDGRSREYEVAASEGGIEATLLRPVTGQVNSVPLPIAESYDLGEPIATLGYAENSLKWNLLIATQGTVAGSTSWGTATADCRISWLT